MLRSVVITLAVSSCLDGSPGCVEVAAEPAPSRLADVPAIIGARGVARHGGLELAIARDDLDYVFGPDGINYTPDFGLSGRLRFEGGHPAHMTGTLVVLDGEFDAFSTALAAQQITLVTIHQHAWTNPQVWIVELAAEGEPGDLARRVRAALGATAVPLPQSAHTAWTALDVHRLAAILGGEARVGNDGTVTVELARGSVAMRPVVFSTDRAVDVLWTGGNDGDYDRMVTAGDPYEIAKTIHDATDQQPN